MTASTHRPIELVQRAMARMLSPQHYAGYKKEQDRWQTWLTLTGREHHTITASAILDYIAALHTLGATRHRIYNTHRALRYLYLRAAADFRIRVALRTIYGWTPQPYQPNGDISYAMALRFNRERYYWQLWLEQTRRHPTRITAADISAYLTAMHADGYRYPTIYNAYLYLRYRHQWSKTDAAARAVRATMKRLRQNTPPRPHHYRLRMRDLSPMPKRTYTIKPHQRQATALEQRLATVIASLQPRAE